MSAITGYLSFSSCDGPDHLYGWCSRAAQAMGVRAQGPISTWADPGAGIVLGYKAHDDASTRDFIVSEDYALVLDGEVFDPVAALPASENSGRSSAGLLLTAIVERGIEPALNHLTGGFTFALWDRRERTLYLGCDRFSERTIYYSVRPGSLVFASTLSALRQYPDWRDEIDRDAVVLLLRHTYIPYPYAIYRGVRKLSPATLLTIHPRARCPQEGTYWRPAEAVPEEKKCLGSRDEVVEELERRIQSAVRRRTTSALSTGVFLSGGIDSSTIAATLQCQSSRRIATFTAGFEEASYDEAPYARAIAAHLQTDHTEICVTAPRVAAIVPRLADIYDEPFADSSQLPVVVLCAVVRQKVAAVLGGEGGDEFFSDMRWLRSVWHLWSRLDKAPKSLRQGASALLRWIEGMLPPRLDWRSFEQLQRYGIDGYLRCQLRGVAELLPMETMEDRYRWLSSDWRDSTMPVLSTSFPGHLFQPAPCYSVQDFLDAIRAFETMCQLPGDFLVKVDRAAAAAGLRSRMPFLDPEVVTFAWKAGSAPEYHSPKANKMLLRQVLYRYVPPALVDRPKQGFTLPLMGMLRGELRDWAEGLLDERRVKSEGFFDSRAVRHAWNELLAGKPEREDPLWAILMFQAWLERSRQR